MKWSAWLAKYKIKLSLSAWVLNAEWEPRDPDRDAAWEMYVELLTRITTQPLPDQEGDEATALKSVYSLFPTTREILREQGRGCTQFAKLAVVILNQKVRPFTAKWHRALEQNKLASQIAAFRRELAKLQEILRTYTRMLGDMAGVEEDLTAIEP